MSTLLSRLRRAAVCACALVVAVPGPALAAPGDLDASFGDGGQVYVHNGLVSAGYDLALQPDGKIVTVGLSQDAGWLTTDFSLMRHHTDGSIDTSFGNGGEVLTDFDGGEDYAHAVTLQSDGKIVVAGRSELPGEGWHFTVARYAADGSLDTGFGDGGRLRTEFGSASEAHAVAVQSDGRIVAAGEAGGRFALVRYLADGTPDPAFGDAGRVTTPFEAGGAYGYDLALQSDGRVVVAGSAGSGGADFALARYNTDGSLDGGFGNGGRVTTAFAGEDLARGVQVQPDGRIVAAGRSGFDIALARYNTDGSLDAGFGTGGRVTTDFGGTLEAAHDLVLQPDGKIVTGGVRSTDFTAVRYRTDGTLDSGFGTGGRASADFTYYDEAHAIALQPDGNLVTFGSSGDDRALVRFLGGTATPPPPPPTDLLSVTKTGPATVSIGDRATYTVTVTNTTTTTTATGVSLTDTLSGPAGTVISATASQGTCTTAVSCSLGTLAPGAQATVTVVAEPRATGTLTERATATATQSDPNSGNNTATVTTTVNNARGCTRIGTSGNDTLTGTFGTDVICGLGGDDTINASYGSDTAYGDFGNDRVDGGFQNDTLSGGPGNDNLIGNNGNDRLNTVDNVSGNDTANGGSGSDTCTTDAGDTRISCP
ncbi:calcium-binding protein [Streptomyces sp. NBC_00287]|uniref:calcium-binding protein n=1 Tax=Streptomyces sp. NBC_00287 TaxID=2975702 RepID=UPI002E2D03F9|nr:calcium-binding protein [Streptomyces sp. NBC_00287]